ncbi:MAG: CAP domain-containing protein [Erythrobacter sp.]|uniref:CAP domain-containing protein n=1 Tax=Erythrobacter sp. TaxID=1042 RepID=UPI0032EE3DE8
MRLHATILAGCAAFLALTFAARGEAPAPSSEATWLAAHNQARAAFGTPPLAWNDTLAREARRWAERLAAEGVLRHSTYEQRNGTGENLWMGSAGHYSPAQMISAFTGEKRHFRAGTFPHVSRTGNWADVGHFTQVVWGDTREVGCAAVRGRQFDVLVCRYWPSGNVMGKRIAPGRFAVRD